MKFVSAILVIAVLYALHSTIFKVEESFGEISNMLPVPSANIKLQHILNSMDYVKKYNAPVHDRLHKIIRDIFAIYYKFIGGEDVNIHDIEFQKSLLYDVYEEISLNLPHKFLARFRENISKINREIDKKIKLLKIKSSKSPIKISLMSTKVNKYDSQFN